MATVENVVINILAVLLYWLFVALNILIIWKLIEMIISIGSSLKGGKWKWPWGKKEGGKEGGGGRDKGGGKNWGDGKDKTGGTKTEEEEFNEARNNPGSLTVFVTNVHDKPVEKAKVELWTIKRGNLFTRAANLVKKGFGKHNRYFPNNTNIHGIARFEDIPSLTYKLRITYKLSKREKYKAKTAYYLEKQKKNIEDLVKPRFWHRGKKISLETMIEVLPGTDKVRKFVLPFESEYDLGFEPFIVDVTITPPKGIRTIGRINAKR